jgi:hypothetical protein
VLVNQEIVSQIQQYWIADQQHAFRGREQRPIPTLEMLSTTIDALFRASLHVEEGKPVKTSIAFVNPADFGGIELPKRRESPLAIRFSPPLPLSTACIGKIGSLANGTTAVLLADPDSLTTPIWGIALASRTSSLLTETAAGTNETRHFLPDCLTITVRGVGALEIARGGSNVARLENGAVRPSQPSPIDVDGLRLPLLHMAGIQIPTQSSSSANEDVWKWHLLRDSIQHLLSEISENGGGASVIFVPAGQVTSASALIETPWAFSGSFELEELSRAAHSFRECSSAKAFSIEGQMAHLFSLRTKQVLRERIETLARLAGIDGGLLLTPALNPIAFGAKLKAEPWKGAMVTGAAAFGTPEQLDFQKLGTRHGSARDFVGACPGAVAFVASTDGPVRALTRTRHDLICYWADCRNSMQT